MTRLMQLPPDRSGQPRLDMPGGPATKRRKRPVPGRLVLSGRVLETSYESTVEKAMRTRGWTFVHHQSARLPDGRYVTAYSPASSPGFPDIVAIRGEWMIVTELKQDGRYPTAAQRMWLGLFAGRPLTLTWVLRPGDAWHDVAHWIDHPEEAPAIYGWKPK